MCSGLPGFLSELEKSEVDRNEMTHYQIINEKATPAMFLDQYTSYLSDR